MPTVVSSALGEQITTLVFLTPKPISVFEEEKWCFRFLLSQGFRIEVLELTKLINKKNYIEIVASIQRPTNRELIREPSSFKEFEDYVSHFRCQAIFVDYLVGHSDVTLKEERVFRVLKRHNARYILLSSGALPLPTIQTGSQAFNAKILLSKAQRAIISPSKLLNYLASKIIIQLTKRRFVYPLPILAFGGKSEKFRQFLSVRMIDKSKVVAINSFDYDQAIALMRSWDNRPLEEEALCVFLDEAATHHSDFEILGIQPAAAEVYFTAMNRYFDSVERGTGLKVIIAAHPRSDYELFPEVFNGRPIVKGKTAELVAKSKLVIVHMSTSIGFAILFKKPILSLKIPGMNDNSYLNLMVEVMAKSIGVNTVDLCRDQSVPNLFQISIDTDKYEDYKNKYLKTDGAENLPEWEIVAKSIKSIVHKG